MYNHLINMCDLCTIIPLDDDDLFVLIVSSYMEIIYLLHYSFIFSLFLFAVVV